MPRKTRSCHLPPPPCHFERSEKSSKLACAPFFNKKILFNLLYPLATIALVFIVWAIAAASVHEQLIIPSIGSTFTEFFNILAKATFYKAVGITLSGVILSFIYAVLSAIAFGLASAVFPVFRKIFAPIASVLRSVPTMSLILLTVIWLDPKGTPIFVGFVIAFPLLYDNIYSALINIDKDLIEVAKSYNLSLKDKVLSVYLPASAPAFFDGAKSALSLAVKIVISAEVIAQTKGSIGMAMQYSKASLETARLLAWTVAAVILSVLLELAVGAIKRLVVRWGRNEAK